MRLDLLRNSLLLLCVFFSTHVSALEEDEIQKLQQSIIKNTDSQTLLELCHPLTRSYDFPQLADVTRSHESKEFQKNGFDKLALVICYDKGSSDDYYAYIAAQRNKSIWYLFVREKPLTREKILSKIIDTTICRFPDAVYSMNIIRKDRQEELLLTPHEEVLMSDFSSFIDNSHFLVLKNGRWQCSYEKQTLLTLKNGRRQSLYEKRTLFVDADEKGNITKLEWTGVGADENKSLNRLFQLFKDNYKKWYPILVKTYGGPNALE